MNMRELLEHYKRNLGVLDARIVAIITIAVCAILNIYFDFSLFTSILLVIGIYLVTIMLFMLYFRFTKK